MHSFLWKRLLNSAGISIFNCGMPFSSRIIKQMVFVSFPSKAVSIAFLTPSYEFLYTLSSYAMICFSAFDTVRIFSIPKRENRSANWACNRSAYIQHSPNSMIRLAVYLAIVPPLNELMYIQTALLLQYSQTPKYMHKAKHDSIT